MGDYVSVTDMDRKTKLARGPSELGSLREKFKAALTKDDATFCRTFMLAPGQANVILNSKAVIAVKSLSAHGHTSGPSTASLPRM